MAVGPLGRSTVPNLVITNACNLDCPFCFASEYRANSGDSRHRRMSVAEFRRQIDFAGADTVRFCGGEPSLHPDFVQMLELALAPEQRGVFIMTNGLWPDSVRRRIGRLSRSQRRRVSYLINVLPYESYRDGQRQRLEATLAQLDPRRVTLGVTLHAPDLDVAALFALARRYRIRQLRYSVAAPNITDPRSWHLDPEHDFRPLAVLVHELVTSARREKLTVHSDCGYIPPCMFTEAQLRDLAPDADSFRCSGPVDIGPGGQAWRCYGLYASMRAHTDDFAHAGALAEHFERRTELLADRFLFDACESCDFRARGACGGGCYAFRSVRAMRKASLAGAVALEDDAELMAAVVTIDDETLHLTRAGTAMVREADGGWAELSLSEVERGLLRACDGTKTLGELVGTGVDALGAAAFVRRLYDQGALTLSRR